MKKLETRTSLQSKKPLQKKTPLKSKIRPVKQKKPAVSNLKKEADKYWSLATRLRFADNKMGEWWVKCVTCPNYKPVKQMQCGHFQSRAFNATRFSEENTAPQCYGCNVMHQGEQYKFSAFIDEFYGEGTAKRLEQEARVKHPFTVEELTQIIEDAKTQIKYSQENYG